MEEVKIEDVVSETEVLEVVPNEAEGNVLPSIDSEVGVVTEEQITEPVVETVNDGDIPKIEGPLDETTEEEVNPDDYNMDTPEGMKAYLDDLAKANPDAMKMMKGLSDDLSHTKSELEKENVKYLEKICAYLNNDGKTVKIEDLDDEALNGFYDSYEEYKKEVEDDDKIKELNLFLSDIKIYLFNKGVLLKQLETRIFTPDKALDEAVNMFDIFMKTLQKTRHKPKQVAHICDKITKNGINPTLTPEDLKVITKWYGDVISKAVLKCGIKGISAEVCVAGIENRIATWMDLIRPSFENLDMVKLESIMKLVIGCGIHRKLHLMCDRGGNLRIGTEIYETESKTLSRLLEMMMAQSLYAERNKYLGVIFEIAMAVAGFDISAISEEDIVVNGFICNFSNKEDSSNEKVKLAQSLNISWNILTSGTTLKFTKEYIENTKKYIEEQKLGEKGTDDEEIVKAEETVKENIIDNLGSGREMPIGSL